MSPTDGDYPVNNGEPMEEAAEAVTIPMSLLGGKTVAPGDTVMLKVTSVNDEDGTVGVEYATETPEAGGVESLAAEFD